MNKTFYNLKELVNVQVSDKFQEPGMWQAMEYEVEGNKGFGLVVGKFNKVPSIELELNAKGWHKVYIGLGNLRGTTSGIGVSLTNEDGKTVLAPINVGSVNGEPNWGGYLAGEEVLYKMTDLTNQKIVFDKAEWYAEGSVVLYVRLEEMTDEEVREYKASGKEQRIMYHFDADYFAEQKYSKPTDYVGRLKMLDHGNGDIIIQECFLEESDVNCNKDKMEWVSTWHGIKNLNDDYVKVNREAKKHLGKTAHDMGLKIYAGYRIERGDFHMPWPLNWANDGLADKYPELRCMTRDGKYIDALSYAYPEVRKITIDKILNTMPDDWDGVSLFFHRGVHVALEQPVIDEVQARYGVDARRVPYADERLHSVICEFTTQFIRDLKAELVKKATKANHSEYKINVVTMFDPASSKYFGCDVETLLKEKLIDSYSQGIMTHFENLEGCMAEDGLIDLDKYVEKKQKSIVLCRRYHDDDTMILNGAKAFLEIQKKYGGEFYGALGWKHRNDHQQVDLAKKLYEIGVEKLLAWNANHSARSCTKINGLKACGNKEMALNGGYKSTSRNFKLNNINGTDVSEFDPNWRG